MVKKIGKYEVLQRIGRGGMGTIYKAHDPVLDRAVALKVISSEVEVTDELRARFFREAQACARFSHPNIVTIYDMGEDDGRLFIVMEMLDGEELRSLVAQRKVLALEDKLTIMLQVCEGLHYAHQKGIVHRDIKPGNIMVLRQGQVKILDFGIARIAAAKADLTRTGLIMGTLRYISPEQVRGRADHRSDIFSVGAVFYELLSFRPPFSGTDPMQILEQLRSEDPRSLRELDPSLPPELVAIVERAMRKDPGERFADLEQMRTQLEQVQRGLTEEAQRIRVRLRGQLEQVRELETALAERVGAARDDATVSLPDERGGRLATLRALEVELMGRLEAGQAMLARVEALAPALQRGLALLQGGQFAPAVAEFEAILAEVPEHGRALDGLSQARAQIDAQRHRQLAAQLMQVRAALAQGRYAHCLELLEQAAAIPSPGEVVPELASLRQAAEAALAEQEAAARYRRAEEAASEARQREIRRAEEARDRVAQGQRAAAAADAEHHAPTLWREAAAKLAGAQFDLAREQYAKAAEAFDEALVLYRQAVNQVEKMRGRQRDQAEEGHRALAERRSAAAAADAPLHAPAEWTEAEAIVASSEAAFAREAYAEASRGFDRGVALYWLAEERARDVVHVLETARLDAVKAGEAIALARQAAVQAQASKYAVEEWRGGESMEVQARAALSRREYAAARSLFAESRRLYAAAAQAAAVAMETEARRADTMTSDARRLLEGGSVSACLRLLSEVLTLQPGHAAAEALRRKAEGKLREREEAARHAAASAALQGDVTVLGSQPADALRAGLAEPPSFTAVRAPAATDILSITSAASGEVSRPATGSGWRFWRLTMGAVGGLAVVGLSVLFWLPRPAPLVSPPAPRVESPAVGDAAAGSDTVALHKREAEEVGQARVAAAKARQEAEHAAAPIRAPRAFALARQKESEAEAALGGQDAAVARLQFQKAQHGYNQATQEAERAAAEEKQRTAALQRQQSDAELARERMAAARRTAEQAGPSQQAALDEAKQESEAQQQVAVLIREEAVRLEADRLAKDVFDAAQTKQAEAERLASRRNYAAASLAFQDATARYMEATRRTQGLRDKSQAESARIRMLAEKQQADPAASDFASGLAEERQGNGLYERQAYREATEKFRSAETFFARAGVRSPRR